MSLALEFEDAQSVADARLFLERASGVTDGVVRFTASGSVLRTTVCTFAPLGILEQVPTVLGMRTFTERSGSTFDAVLSARSILDRIAHLQPGDTVLGIPPVRESAAWVGVDSPKSGWVATGQVSTESLNGVALAGIAEVADALPEKPGEVLVREVRGHVWGSSLMELPELPKSVAFTAHMLGFLSQDAPALVFESGQWMRLSTKTGHVLVYRR